jgi:integrase/recombinase XerC
MPLLLGYGLLVHGKGGKKRMVGLPVDGTLGLELARMARQDPGYLFPGKIDGHLSASWVGRIVSRWLDGPWTMHTLRHFFATTTFAKSKNLLAVHRHPAGRPPGARRHRRGGAQCLMTSCWPHASRAHVVA